MTHIKIKTGSDSLEVEKWDGIHHIDVFEEDNYDSEISCIKMTLEQLEELSIKLQKYIETEKQNTNGGK